MKRVSTPTLALCLAGLLAITAAKSSADAAGRQAQVLDTVCSTLSTNGPQFRLSAHRLPARALRVVVIGSSSTAGVGASRPALGYVNVLAGQLDARWPAPTQVLNKGVSGDTLSATLARAGRDVYALHPDVVVLQSGTNDALRGVPATVYRQQLQGFVLSLKSRRIAVLLVDNQYLPDQLNSASYRAVQAATHDVARQQRVPLVSRFSLSETLQQALHLRPQDLLADDGLHPNDLMHRCTADALAATLLGAVQQGRAAGVN